MAYTKNGGYIMDKYQISTKTLCIDCKHLNGSTKYGSIYTTFPNKILAGVWWGDINHSEFIEGDHGIKYEPLMMYLSMKILN